MRKITALRSRSARWLVAAALAVAPFITASAEEPSEEALMVEVSVGNQLNRFASFEEYRAAGTTASVLARTLRPKSEVTGSPLYVIYGVDMKSEQFKGGDFLWAGALSQYPGSDYDLDGLSLPITGAVITFRKATIDLLAPDASRFVIDGKESTREDFDKLDVDTLRCVTIKGNSILITTAFILETPNYDEKKASEDEGRLMRLMFAAPAGQNAE